MLFGLKIDVSNFFQPYLRKMVVVCFDDILLHLKCCIHVMSIYRYWLGSL